MSKTKSVIGRTLKTKIQVEFENGQTAVVAFGLKDPAKIELVIKAWAVLYQRFVKGWKRTTEPAEFFYDGRRKQMQRCDNPDYHDFLDLPILMELGIQLRRDEVMKLRAKGLGPRDIARKLKLPVHGVSKLLQEAKVKLPPLRVAGPA